MSLISQNKVKIEGGMSSMTDLVFLLLIFFIILSALAKNAVDVDLPEGGTTSNPKAAMASIVVKPDNTILLNNKVIQFEQLGDAVEKEFGNSGSYSFSFRCPSRRRSDCAGKINL